MRKLVFVFIVCLSAIVLDAKVVLSKYSESVYICDDQFFPRENSLVYIGPEFITIIGATWCPASAEALHDLVTQISDKPVLEVINTNYHPDRAGGNPYWKSIGCEIHSTVMTSDLMKSDWDKICSFVRSGIPDFPEIPLATPSTTHEGSFQLQGGKVQVLYLGPSHTEDGVFVYLPNEKLLYGGCIIKPFLGNLEQANVEQYPKTLEKLKELDLEIETIVAGHGHPIHGYSLIDNYLNLLESHMAAKSGPENDPAR